MMGLTEALGPRVNLGEVTLHCPGCATDDFV